MEDSPQTFQITLGDFSGPLDLLCHLVESRSMDPSSVKLTEVLSQYVSYLFNAEKATLAELAEFFSLASRLLLRKVRSLLPGADGDLDDAPGDSPEDISEDSETGEEELRAIVRRFMPYRAAVRRMSEMKALRDMSFVRISDEGGPPWFDIGDLYGLSTLWWRLIEERSRRKSADAGAAFMADIPDAAPEEVLVEQRMGDILKNLSEARGSSLRGLLEFFGAGELIVTLLALLELSRLGKITLAQSAAWEDVKIATA
jgi:segregation and condensation protein A